MIKILGQNSPSAWSRRDKINRLLWVLVRSSLFRWSPRMAFGWRNMILRLFGAKISRNAIAPPRVWPDADIYVPQNLIMETGALIGPGCRIYNLAPFTMKVGANLSRHVHLCNGSHDFTRWEMPLIREAVELGINVWVGADCFIGAGVNIGEASVIGARSVVVKSLPSQKICVGNPCRPISPRPPLS